MWRMPSPGYHTLAGFQAMRLLGYDLYMLTTACAQWNRRSSCGGQHYKRQHVQKGSMRDEHNPYRDDVYWQMEKIRKADMAAAQEGRRWEGAGL